MKKAKIALFGALLSLSAALGACSSGAAVVVPDGMEKATLWNVEKFEETVSEAGDVTFTMHGMDQSVTSATAFDEDVQAQLGYLVEKEGECEIVLMFEDGSTKQVYDLRGCKT